MLTGIAESLSLDCLQIRRTRFDNTLSSVILDVSFQALDAVRVYRTPFSESVLVNCVTLAISCFSMVARKMRDNLYKPWYSTNIGYRLHMWELEKMFDSNTQASKVIEYGYL